MKRFEIMVAAALLLTACNKRDDDRATAPDYVKAHDIKQLMAMVVQPQADVFWQSVGSISDASGVHDLSPTTDEGWLRVRSAAATVTEMGNLLMTPQYAEGRGKDWMQFSKALAEIGMKAEKAAADRSSDAISDVGGTMYNVCSACHQVYPPAAGETPDKAAGNAS